MGRQMLPLSLAVLTLPQYKCSESISSRIWDDWSDCPNSKKLDRATISEQECDEPTIWQVEATSDLLSYFSEQLEYIRAEFLEELAAKITLERASLLLDDIAKDWFCGDRQRTANQRLEASCWKYFSMVSPIAASKLSTLAPNTEASYSQGEIAALATCTQHSLTKHLHCWIERHPEGRSLGSHDIYLRRGLPLREPYRTGDIFNDAHVLASYSLSITVCEQFSTQADGPIAAPSLFHIPYDLANDRVLFFSPLIPGMPDGQLEIVLMPPADDFLVLHQGVFGQTHENLLCTKKNFAEDLQANEERLYQLSQFRTDIETID